MSHPTTLPAPRAFTQEEAKEAFLNQIRSLVQYWARADNAGGEEEKLSGLAFSILNIFDGTTALPGMDITLRPHESDEQYCRENGENWWPSGLVINAGMLHDDFYLRPADAAPVGCPGCGHLSCCCC